MSECDACGHEGDDVELSLGGHSRCEANLCKFCRDTDAGNTFIYPGGYTKEMIFQARLIAQMYWMLTTK